MMHNAQTSLLWSQALLTLWKMSIMKYTLPLLKVLMYDWILKWEAVINDGLEPTLFIWTEQQYKKPHNCDVSGWP